MNPRAYGIVRADLAPEAVDGHVHAIRAFAVERGWDLRAVFVEPSDAWFPMLVASIGAPGNWSVVVPTSAHLGGWMDVVRQSVEVWTLHPPMRRPCTGTGRYLRRGGDAPFGTGIP
ncbi:hypothetical protein [Nocardia blacklockiae]|uniref:hypothetical protein n=1 Tax=Nocardia blacklockiae TaxID=480036 RepID=UPI0018945596|nr:hypothetical protein [Nocardia blacklockiae]MBF6173741.1 hypothetical protein [Nocardia blacklockiae]